MKIRKRRSANKKSTGYLYDPRTDGVSQSMLATFLSCREAARLSIIQGLTSRAVSVPLIFGDISHEVLDQYYKDLKGSKAKTCGTFVENIPKYVDNAVRTWREMNPRATTSSLEEVEKAATLIQRIHPEYVEFWWKDDRAYTWVATEEEFAISCEIPYVDHSTGKTEIVTVPVRGRRDGEFVWKNKRWLFETKNKSRWSGYLDQLLPLDLQVGLYITRLEMERNSSVAGVVYNLIRRPGERQGKTESYNDYAERILGNIRKDPNHYFERYRVHLTSKEKKAHADAVIAKVAEFYRWWAGQSHDTMDPCYNSGNCENKYGTCGYLPVCSNQDRSGHYVREQIHPELSPKNLR